MLEGFKRADYIFRIYFSLSEINRYQRIYSVRKIYFLSAYYAPIIFHDPWS